MFRSLGMRLGIDHSDDDEHGPAVQARSVALGFDVPFLLVVVTLIIFGLVMVYSASYDSSRYYYGNPTHVLLRQILWLGIGVAGAIFLAFFHYRYLTKLAVPLMVITLVLLVLVLIVSEIRYNAARTLLSGSIQPSELAKIVAVIYLSVWLYAKREDLSNVTIGLLPLGGILGILGGLIFIQPDLSAVITIVALGGIMFFLAGGDLRQIFFLLVLMGVIVWLIVQFNPTGSDRVAEYFQGLKDPTKSSYHVRRSLEAFVHGGWLGVGIGNGDTKLTGLPFPHTDSIFAVVGEETGLVGCLVLVSLYVLLLLRGLAIAHRAPDLLSSLLVAGLTIWLVLEAFINMAVMINLLPFAGNALPFISAGGSSLVVSLAAVGIIINVSRLSLQSEAESGRTFRAVVDLRRRDRRRRVSRANRVDRAKSS